MHIYSKKRNSFISLFSNAHWLFKYIDLNVFFWHELDSYRTIESVTEFHIFFKSRFAKLEFSLGINRDARFRYYSFANKQVCNSFDKPKRKQDNNKNGKDISFKNNIVYFKSA